MPSNISLPKLDALMDGGATTMDKQKRLKIYFDAIKLIYEEVPWGWSYQQVDIYGVSERVDWKARLDERLEVFNMSFKK